MIRSMTGYGRAETVLAGRKFAIEMKSVNHRYLEISLRLPGMLQPFDTEIKKKIGEQLKIIVQYFLLLILSISIPNKFLFFELLFYS